ncbi:MAG: tetratricopeptide repeat-containing sensor histidine kinase [Bacteroidales bacterium]|nr:tetratricopeptide repeat-containing sensor histidine kinase [Bacteroidales bacterium]
MKLLKTIFIIITILFLLQNGIINSQDTVKTDSILTLIDNSPDSLKINIYKELAWSLRNISPIKAYEYGYNALVIAEKLNNKKELSIIYNYLGVFKRNLNDYPGALDNYFKGLKNAEEINYNIEIAYSYNNIGNIYNLQNNYSLAIEYFTNALEIFTKINDKKGIAYCYNQISLLYMNQDKYDLALDYNNRAIKIRKELNDQITLAGSIKNEGDIYFYKKNYTLALKYYKESLDLDIKTGQKISFAFTYNRIGKLYNTTENYAKAIPYLEKGLAIGKETKSVAVINNTTKELSISYAGLNDCENAYYYHVLHKKMSDSLLNEENIRQITMLGMKYEFDKKQKEQELEQQKNEIIATKERKIQKQIRNSFFAGLIFMIIIVFLIYRSYNIKKKVNQVLIINNEQINEQKEELLVMNNLLIDNEKQLKEANITKDKFFSIISHDLQTPFNAVIGYSNLLYNEFDRLDEARKMKYIGNVKDVSENAYKLLQNLLEWSRSQTGRIEFLPEVMDLEIMVSEIIMLLSQNAEKKNIQLHSLVNSNTTAYGDINMIDTVIRNLISNAIKFTPKNGEISVSCQDYNDKIKITVSDNGVGISKENISKLFKIDDKYKTFGTEEEEGTGLGLILCKEFVEKNKGEIWVESEEGKGSSFIFTIPKTK